MQDFKSTAVFSHNKVYASFSNRTQCLGHTWYDLKMSLTQANKMVWFIRFFVNAAKCISGKQGEQSGKDKRTWCPETHGLLVSKPSHFQNVLTRPGTFQFGTRLSLLIVTHTGTLVGLKRPST